MTKRLVKSGNSYGLLIDRALLHALGFTPNSKLELLLIGTALVIRKTGRTITKTGKRSGRRAPKPGKKLIQSGHSFVLIIDKPLMDVMGITPETVLEIRTLGRSMLLRKRVIKLTREERAQRNEQQAIEDEQNDPMYILAHLNEYEKPVSAKLILVDGKWILPEPGDERTSDNPDKHTMILEMAQEEEKKRKGGH